MSAAAVPDIRSQAGPHVFVADLEELELADDDRHHLARSLRLRPGDPLTVSDAAGRWRTAVFGDIVEATGEIHLVAPPRYELGLGVALTKAAKPEFAVQKATEIGIDTVVVFPAEHSVAQWDETKRLRNGHRLTKIARESAMQSRRVTIPSVAVVENLAAVVDRYQVARADFGGIPTIPNHRFLLIGPEGGWSEQERIMVPKAVDLGQTVLRAETAAVVASALLVQSRSQSD